MANPTIAVDFTLRLEDSTLSGVITDIPGDLGGTTRFGLTAKYHPELVAAGFFDSTMNTQTALSIAEQSYAESYANPLLISQISNQALANALLSFAVNEEGTGRQGEAVKLLQEAAGAGADGVMGPGTIAAVNGCDPVALLKGYCGLQQTHYEAIVAANPSQQKFIKGWTSRVSQVAAQPSSGTISV
jgi:lysozyme family protein